MGQAKQRKAEIDALKANSEKVAVVTPDGVEEFSSMDDYFNKVSDSLSRGVNNLISQMNGSNVDLTILDKPSFQSKTYNLSGKKFNIDIHADNLAVSAIAKHSGRDLGAVIQIWNDSKSILVTQTKKALEDARINWNGEARIKKDDIVSQSVSALRLSIDNPAVHHIAMFLAYEHEDKVDASGCHAVWD